MKIQVLFVLLLCGSLCAPAQKKLLLGGSGWNKIVLLDKKSKQVEWSHRLNPGDECNCVAYTKKGQILYAYRKGAKLITKDGQTVWDYPVAGEGELHTASVLPDGGYLLGITGKPARIVELDKKGKVRKEITYDTRINSLHGQFRQLRKSREGTYLVPLMSRHTVVELDADGKLLQSYNAEGNTFSVLELKNGNLLISCGDAHSFLEVDRKTGDLLRKVKQNDIDGVALQVVAEIAAVKDHLLVCNWAGHSRVKDQPSLIELDADGKVVWSLCDSENIRNVSAVCPVK